MGNALNADLTDRHVIIRADACSVEFAELSWRVFLVEGGFGAKAFTNGRAVFGTFVRDGERSRIDGWDVERFATDAEVEAARLAAGAS